MKIAQKLTDLVGNTPLLQLNKFSAINEVEGATIVAKLEYFNPAGSVKDRVALAMINDAEQSGKLKPGATIIEPFLLLVYSSENKSQNYCEANMKSPTLLVVLFLSY